MAILRTLVLATAASALVAPLRRPTNMCRPTNMRRPTARYSQVEEPAAPAEAPIEDTAAVVDEVVAEAGLEAAVESLEASFDRPSIYTPLFGKKELEYQRGLTAPVSPLGEFLIKWGFKEDPRIPKDERVDQMTRIKESGQAGVIAYALIEGAFWIGSIPFAYAAVTLATGAFPDVGTIEGKEALSADAFVFINFARLIVPARIALALSLAPWTDENIVKKFFPPAADGEA